MKSRSIIVADADMDRLSRLVQALKHSPFRDQLQLESLEQTLASAEVAPWEIARRAAAAATRIARRAVSMGASLRVSLILADDFTGRAPPQSRPSA